MVAFDNELALNEEEKKILTIITSFLPSENSEHVLVKRRSKNYISMFCGVNDFLRLKYSKKARWLSLRLPAALSAANIENPLFAAQFDKKQFHWRTNLSSGINNIEHDLNLLKDFIIASCIYVPE